MAQVRRELRDIPQRKEMIAGRLEEHRRELEKAREDFKRHGLQIKELDGEVEAVRQKINRFRGQQLTVKTNDEYRALESEIQAAEGKIRDLEDRELVLMEEAEELKGAVAARERELEPEAEAVREEQGRLDERASEIERETEELSGRRDELAGDIDRDLLQRYERILDHTGDYAVVSVENGSCGGCHMRLPPQAVHNARRGESVTSCSYCGRILYY
jgi:predicted  nucleic acid-binding Zn-ribbon protein